MTEADFRIRNRAELVDALTVAARVEHLVLLEYLYAAFSCRHTQDPSVPARVQVTSWELARELYAIAHDEMDHLGAVQQLLAALGAPPVPDAWSFPVADPRLPFPCELTRLDADAVERFVQTESPQVVVEAEAALPTPPDPIRFDVLGDLYRAIVDGLRRLGDAVFLGTAVTGREPSRLTAGPASASPPRGRCRHDRDSHHRGRGLLRRRPHRTLAALRRHAQCPAGLGPDAHLVSWPCVPNPVLRDADAAGTTLVTDPVTVAVADIANRTYRALWLLLGGTYVHDWSAADPEATIQRRRLLQGRYERRPLGDGDRGTPAGEILARLRPMPTSQRPDGRHVLRAVRRVPRARPAGRPPERRPRRAGGDRGRPRPRH